MSILSIGWMPLLREGFGRVVEYLAASESDGYDADQYEGGFCHAN
jgi:hypothetical protein